MESDTIPKIICLCICVLLLSLFLVSWPLDSPVAAPGAHSHPGDGEGRVLGQVVLLCSGALCGFVLLVPLELNLFRVCYHSQNYMFVYLCIVTKFVSGFVSLGSPLAAPGAHAGVMARGGFSGKSCCFAVGRSAALGSLCRGS